MLAGAFIFKKLWLGALVAILYFIISKSIQLSGIEFIHTPLSTGAIISFELILLIIGAYLFYNILTFTKHFDPFIRVTSTFESKLFSLLILCVFVEGFMEGVAGFGIPAMLIAPLMITVGFKPLTSIVIPLASNTTAVTFGALGTPLKVGLGIYEVDTTVIYTLIINSFPAFVLPFILAFLYSKTENVNVIWKNEWKMLLGAGLAFVIPYILVGLISVEYPSVAAGIVGLLIFVTFFSNEKHKPPVGFWIKTFAPYILFVVLLLLSKFLLIDYSWKVSHNKVISFYQPGLVFVLSGFVYLMHVSKHKVFNVLFKQAGETLTKTAKSVLTIFLLVVFTQLIQEDLSDVIRENYVQLSLTTKLILNPLIGVAGSFISGSATMSNLLFGEFIKGDIISGGVLPLLLALLHTGSAIGNAISLQNIVMVKTVVSQSDVEIHKILFYNLLLVGIYLILIILVSSLILNMGFYP